MVIRSLKTGLVLAVVAAFLFLPHFLSELLAFIFIGIVPYSTHTIPVWWMLLIDLTLLALGIRWLLTQFTLLTHSEKRDLKKRRIARTEVYRISRRLDRKNARLARAAARAERKALSTAPEPTNA